MLSRTVASLGLIAVLTLAVSCGSTARTEPSVAPTRTPPTAEAQPSLTPTVQPLQQTTGIAEAVCIVGWTDDIPVGWLPVACTGASGQGRSVNPAPPTPGPTPPGIQSVDEAIQYAKYFIGGHTNVNLRSARIESVAYVETTVGVAENFLGGYVLGMSKLVPPDTTAWLFVAQGDFAHRDRYSAPPLARGTLWVLAVRGGAASANIAETPLDLAKLGTPVVIPRGRVAEIDAVRAPAEGDAPIPASTPTPGGALLGS